MKRKLNTLILCLKNENGAGNVEQVIGIAVSLATGVGLFIFGRYVYNWYNGCAGETVEQIGIPPARQFYTLK